MKTPGPASTRAPHAPKPFSVISPSTRIESVLFLAILLLSAFIANRFIQQRGFPGGDEGTWMAPSSRVLAGEGFTTNWLVKQDLVPYQVPRPDDLRFPGLVYAMALAFKVFGTSYATGLGLVFAIHLGFLAMVYWVCRRYFDVPTALLTLLLTGVSPLQLYWNTHIYSEGLFGLVTAGLLIWTKGASASRPGWWIGAGLGVGLLALVKLHALLFVPGFFVLYGLGRRYARRHPDQGIRFSHLWLGLAALFLILSPWLIRNAVLFGNPVHSAQNAWIFRYTLEDPTDLGMAEFAARHGPTVFFRKLGLGLKVLMENWDEYDHGLERIPLLLALIGVVRRVRFFNPLVATGFALLFLGSAYTSYPFWIGIRFWSPLAPFVIAYGVFQIRPILEGIRSAKVPQVLARFRGPELGNPLRRLLGHPLGQTAAWALIAATLAYPAFHPLKFHMRQPVAAADHGGAEMSGIISRLEAVVSPDDVYLAASLGQLSFMTSRKCVTLDDGYHMEKWVPRMLSTFAPRIVALRPGEDSLSNIRAALRLVEAEGYALDTLSADPFAVLYRIRPLTPLP